MDPYQADLSCREAFFFKNNSKPANGARAFGSYRNQKNRIHGIRAHRFGHFPGRVCEFQGMGSTGYGVMKVGDRTNCAFGGQFVQTLQRKTYVQVLLKSGAIKIYRYMAHHYIARVDITWNDPIIGCVPLVDVITAQI